MKNLSFYEQKGLEGEKIFEYFIASMRPSIAGWDYFVDWSKVRREAKKYTDELNLLNGLIGSQDLRADFLRLLQKYPSVVMAFPTLIAVRDRVVLVSEIKNEELFTNSYVFNTKEKLSSPEDYWHFFKESGLSSLIESKELKSLTDYVFGVEVGLDTNGRKNRGGDAMENIVESFLKPFCESRGFRYITEANAYKIKRELGYIVPVDKSSRRYDFVIDTRSEPVLIETNFYGGGGSKLKSTAGEYRNLYDVLNGKFKFIWITDGAGWRKTQLPLRETFEHNDYVFNLSMLSDGVLETVF